MTLEKIYLPNQCYFVTTNVLGRNWTFGKLKDNIYQPHDQICQLVINDLDFYRSKFNFLLQGYVIMPDHLHLIISTAGDKSPATRGKGINIPPRVGENLGAKRSYVYE